MQLNINKFYLSFFALLIFLFGSGELVSQIDQYRPIRVKGIKPHVCNMPILEGVHPSYVPRKRHNAINTRKSDVRVIFGGSVPEAAKKAVEDGVIDIISNIFASDIPIIIKMDFGTLTLPGSLAGARPNGWYSNFTNIPVFNSVYPVALAEKIARRELNEVGEEDIVVTVNNTADWFYDFENPGNIGGKYDFVTILLHEILHGLGFSSQVGIQESTGFGFIGTFSGDAHTAYVDNIYDGSNKKITDFQDGTITMAEVLTNDNLFFNSTSSEEKFKLYAPFTFTGGSSISHLDENFYNNTSSSLMTPMVARGKISHDPGLGTELLYDLGWSYTYIIHDRGSSTVEVDVNTDFEVVATVESDAGIEEGTFKLRYSADNFLTESVVDMVKGDSESYSATILAPGEAKDYKYYFEIFDVRGQKFLNPGITTSGVQQTYLYTFGPDMGLPNIRHNSIKSVKSKDPGLRVIANVTDAFTGVNEVFVEWRINDEVQPTFIIPFDSLNTFEDDRYEGLIRFSGELNTTDKLEYRLRATDRAASPNLARTPRGETYYEVDIVPSLDPVLVYNNDFNTASEDFEGDGFSIASPSGFTSPAIHSIHPYESPGGDATIDYTYELKLPIIIDDEYSFIEFNEVVMVEPGDPGTVFGEQEFWDYVIVEARAFTSSDWKPLLDGYDSRAQNTWLTQYNAGIATGGQNSTTVGNSSLMFNRKFDIRQKGDFVAGDTIVVRFRMFSDPFAFGWGWAIDDLKIQELAVSVVDTELDEGIIVYPNPVSDNMVYVKISAENFSAGYFTLHSIDGRLIEKRNIMEREFSIDLPDFANMYIMKIRTNSGIVTRKIIKQ